MNYIDYEKQATDFLKKYETEINIRFVGLKINREWGENKERPLYEVTLKNKRHVFSFDFWDSIYNAQKSKERKPVRVTAYDVLTCLTSYDVGIFEDFCADFGYDTDSRKAEKIYFAAQDEYNNLKKLFPAEALEELQEIN